MKWFNHGLGVLLHCEVLRKLVCDKSLAIPTAESFYLTNFPVKYSPNLLELWIDLLHNMIVFHKN